MAALLVPLFGFTSWLVISNPGGENSTLNGWGLISGVPGVDSQNINDVIASLDGSGSYRPALLPTALAVLALLSGSWLIIADHKVSKLAAAAAAACGMSLAGWGLYRGLVPGDVAGILTDGEYRAGPGAWLVLAAGITIIAIAAWVLAQRQPAAASAARSRGIQPRR